MVDKLAHVPMSRKVYKKREYVQAAQKATDFRRSVIGTLLQELGIVSCFKSGSEVAVLAEQKFIFAN